MTDPNINRRQQYIRWLVYEWAREHRPDVLETCRELAYDKYPSTGNRGGRPTTRPLPKRLANIK